MAKVNRVLVVTAPIKTVWAILDEPRYIPKLYPDVLEIRVDPEGPVVVGQKRTITARMGTRSVELHTKVAEAIPEKKLVLVQGEGGGFEHFRQELVLYAVGGGTEVHASFESRISRDYFGPNISEVMIDRLTMDNADRFLTNLKELSELRPLR